MISKRAANQITTRGVCVCVYRVSRKSMSGQNLRDRPSDNVIEKKLKETSHVFLN